MKVDFVRRHQVDHDEVLGARWWNESFHAFHAGHLVSRRTLVSAVPWLIMGGVGTAVLAAMCNGSGSDDDDSSSISLEALALQRKEGWSVAASPQALAALNPGTNIDVDASAGWRLKVADLVRLLTPDPAWRSYGVPTLFQALADPANGSLRDIIHPYLAPDAPAAYARGEAMRGLATQADAPTDLAMLVDLPGPQSVAFAAAMAPVFDPIFTFDNWPHPLGVVPSHLTLGACLYYLPRFETAARTRFENAPPLFVLDANRLAPYRDDANQFDNRYVAPVPSAAALQGLGVKRVLYVRPDARSLTELDDLNGDFVSWQAAGIAVRAVALSDFVAADLQATPDAGARFAATGPAYYYGGHPYYHHLFWSSYGYGVGTAPRPTRFVVSPPPARLSGATDYRPSFRPTIFATRSVGGLSGIGKQKPSGFGRVSVRMGSNGRVTSLGSSRSGSFGRSRSSYSG